MLIDNMTMKEFAAGIKKTKTLVVPYGTVEAHGNHLPLGTDTMIMWEAVKRASEKYPVFVAPVLHYGVCSSTSQHPGTISITPDTLRALTFDIVRSGYEKGLRDFVLISGHGGGVHVSAMKEAADILTSELKGATIAACMVYEVLPPEAESIADTPNDSHAGELETSLILYINEDLVKGRSKEEYPKMPKPIIARNKQKYWPGAVWGNPNKASIEKGEKLLSVMVDSVIELVKKVEKFKG